MKKRNVINLIKYFAEGNVPAFRDEAYEIATEFNAAGDYQLGNYILALLSNQNTFIPQEMNNKSDFFRKVAPSDSPLPLPTPISDDLLGIINAVNYNAGINKFLFAGAPGTGKTESAKHLARILERDLYAIDFDSLIDSRLGQTSKNISDLFDELNSLPYPDHVLILFDEIDALAMDRIDSRDLREMGRATSSVLKGFDSLKSEIVIIATTNLQNSFDKAFLRRFDKIVDYNRYSQEDLKQIAESILDDQLSKFRFAGKNIKLFRKIVSLMNPIPLPGELKNLIRSSIAFSNPNDEYDYLRLLLRQMVPLFNEEYSDYQKAGFTLREMELLTKVSKSSIARELQKEHN